MSTLEYLRSRYYDQPLEVSIETQASCNAACTFCPYPTLPRKHQQLSTEVLTELVKQMARFREPFFISPFKVSDPLIDKRMSWLCQKIEREVPQAKIRLFTNGSMLTEAQMGWIGDLQHLDHLWISLNSCDPVEYNALMGLRYLLVERRVSALWEEWSAGRFKQTVILSRVSTSQDGRPDDKDRLFESAVRSTWPGFKPFLIKRDGWLGYVPPGDPEIPVAACARWFELSIMADGRAALCCMDGTGEYSTGNIYRSTLLEIYNQPVLRKRRLQREDRTGIDPCERCTY